MKFGSNSESESMLRRQYVFHVQYLNNYISQDVHSPKRKHVEILKHKTRKHCPESVTADVKLMSCLPGLDTCIKPNISELETGQQISSEKFTKIVSLECQGVTCLI